jgi:hypothetical protein
MLQEPASTQVVVTVVFGSHAERLDETFTSFATRAPGSLHAFVIGGRLPERRAPGVTYHLKPPEPAFSHPLRDADFRRWEFIDELGAPFAMVVDGCDALCLQPIPPVADLLRGRAVGACVENAGGRYLDGVLWTANFLNAGVTFWNVPASRTIREKILRRGRTQFRNLIDDQLALNEIVHTEHPDDLAILPCHYNYRAHVAPERRRGWPTVPHLDGIRIYHNWRCIEAVKRGLPPAGQAALAPLSPDPGPLDSRQQFWRRLRQRLKPEIVR